MVASPATELTSLLAEVRRIEVFSHRLVMGVMTGAYRSVFRGSGIEFEEVREYVEGDDPRSVDWNVTARMGHPFVKTFVDERERSLLFLLDLSESMNAGFGHWSSRQMAAHLCACLALAAVKNNDKVGLAGVHREVEAYSAPRKGRGHALRIIRHCLALPTRPGPTNWKAALDLAASAIPRHSVVFLVSDFLGEVGGAALAACARRNDVVALRLVLPELVPPPSGLWRLRDPETGREQAVDASHVPTREALAARVAAGRARTDAAFRRAGVDVVDVPLPRTRDHHAVAQPLVEFFRRRSMRRRLVL